jgi:formate dehydrogenase major subunit
MAEIASLTPLFAGVTYERLEGYKTLQWPVHPDGTDEPLLFTEKFNFPDGKARFYQWDGLSRRSRWMKNLICCSTTAVCSSIFNMTYKANGIKSKTPDVWIEVSHQLAAERKIEDGRLVELTMRYGKVRLRALVTDRVQGHQLYMPMNSSESAVNRLTGSHTDHVTHTPAYKETAVKMRVLDEVKESPLPRINHRFGTPAPQRGFEVERKWKRPDYRMPRTNGQTKNS